MGSHRNVLIVEDDVEWQGTYERTIAAQDPGLAVKIAKDFVGAVRMIEMAKFAVAFVDISLSVSDDRNVDGLRVVESIRAAGDETSIVLVTGRSGQDILPMIRDAITKYYVYDTVGKRNITPSDIERLLRGGLDAYRNAVVADYWAVGRAFRMVADTMNGDRQFIEARQLEHASGLWLRFLDKLLGEYLPLVPLDSSVAVQLSHAAGVAYGSYWSRSAMSAVFLCVGPAGDFDRFMDAVRADPRSFGQYEYKPSEELSANGVKGCAFLLRGATAP